MTNSVLTAVSLLVGLAIGVPEAQERPQRLEEEAKRQIGKTATLCGVFVAYRCQRPDRVSILTLEKPGSASGVDLSIAVEDRHKFGRLFEQRLVGHEMCATGRVEKRKKRYVITVTEPEQLRLEGLTREMSDFPPDAASTCDEGVEVPKLQKEVRPQYTQAALNARLQGVVLLEAVVLTSGQVGGIRILRSLDAKLGLDEQAVEALKAWKFSPGTLRGQPLPVVVTVELSFRP